MKTNKKILVIRDFRYKIPNDFAPDLADVSAFLNTAPTLVWIAEYHHQCVLKIQEFLGAPDKILVKFFEFAIETGTSDRWAKKIGTSISIAKWTLPLRFAIDGLQKNFQFPIENIKFLNINGQGISKGDATIFRELKKLERLVVENEMTDESFGYLLEILQNIPTLKELVISKKSLTEANEEKLKVVTKANVVAQ